MAIDPKDGPELPDDLVVTTTTDADVDVRKAYGIEPEAEADETDKSDEPAEDAPPAAAAKADIEDPDDKVEETAEKPAVPAPKKKESWRERNDRLKAETNALTKQRGALQRELDALEAAKRAAAIPPAAAVPDKKPDEPAALKARPRLDQFQTTEDYEAAMDTWDAERADALKAQATEATRKEIATLARQQAEQDAIRVHAEHVESYKAQCADARSKHADFDEVVSQNADLKISGLMEQAVLESERGAELAYWLGTHPEEAKELADDTLGLLNEHPTQDQIRKALNITRRALERNLAAPAAVPKAAAPGATPPKKLAPRPIPAAGGGAPASTVPLDQLDIDAYMEKRDREEAAAVGRL